LSTAYGAIWHDQKLDAVAHNGSTDTATEVLVESMRRFDSCIFKELHIHRRKVRFKPGRLRQMIQTAFMAQVRDIAAVSRIRGTCCEPFGFFPGKEPSPFCSAAS
jgi:hypothetical protein